jgi:multidrug efflux pump subunit AcrA (membrane-fusion protein)
MLVSGMYVKVRIPIVSPVPLVQVPLRAVQPGGEVWTVREGTLGIEPVEVARIQDEVALLRLRENGLRPGDQVVVSPLAGPVPGMTVEAIDAPTAEVSATASPSSAGDGGGEDLSR